MAKSKKTHKVVIHWEDTMQTKNTRSFHTKEEAQAFIEGIQLAGMVDGMNGCSLKYVKP